MLSREVALSSEAIRLPITPPRLPKELVVASPCELDRIEIKGLPYRGVHFRTTTREDFFDRLTQIIEKVGKRNLSYVTIHLDELPPDEQSILSLLQALNQKARASNVMLLLENVTPRVDEELEPWRYSLLEFWQKYNNHLSTLSNIGFCLDISHLMEAEPAVMEVIERVFEARLTETADLRKVLDEDQINLWQKFTTILSKTKTIHWSRTKEAQPLERKKLFNLLRSFIDRLPPKVKEKCSGYIHYLYTLHKNILNEHYSVISDPELFVIMTDLLNLLNWHGLIVIESPDLLILLREKQRPFYREVGQLHQAMIEEPTKKYLNRFLKLHLSKISGVSLDDIDDLCDFSFSPLPSEKFFQLLTRVFPLLVDVYSDNNKNLLRRKVNKGLYLRHILKGAVLADRYFDLLKEKNLVTDEDYERLILSILFHDALELWRADHELLFNMLRIKLNELGIDNELVNKLIGDIRILTQEELPDDRTYLDMKNDSFNTLINSFNVGIKMPLVVKIFDILANMEETIKDYKKGLEPNDNMRPPQDRCQVFFIRVNAIYNLIGLNPLVETLFDKLDTLLLLTSSHKQVKKTF